MRNTLLLMLVLLVGLEAPDVEASRWSSWRRTRFNRMRTYRQRRNPFFFGFENFFSNRQPQPEPLPDQLQDHGDGHQSIPPQQFPDDGQAQNRYQADSTPPRPQPIAGNTTEDLKQRWLQTNPNLTQNQFLLALAVAQYGGKSVEGKFDPTVCQLSDRYAQSDANVDQQQGHAGFGQRFQQLTTWFKNPWNGQSVAAENEAESWPWLGNNPWSAAKDCVKAWSQSPGHKKAMERPSTRFCYSMEKGASGKMYCIGLYQYDHEVPEIMIR